MARIPDHATRVFKGILFDVFQWEQTLFDGSTTTFEAIRRAASVQIIATTPEDRIILLAEEQPFVGCFLSVPGGRVEEGDTPEATARKELLEELGMAPDELELWRASHSGTTIQWQSHEFIARRCRSVCLPEQEPGERIEPLLVTFEELFERVEEPQFRNKQLADYLFRLRHTPGALEGFRRKLFG